MSNWKADYIRMWQIYFDKPMLTREVDIIMDNKYHWEVEHHLKAYKFGKLLEAVDKLRFPN